MMDRQYDVIVAGSGFAGSLISAILSKLNYKVLLLEKGKHPRFALGESATPITTHFFERFAAKFDIPNLNHFSSYPRMRVGAKELNCGPKELFYYMHHSIDENESDELPEEVVVQTRSIDLQYDRADLDLYLVNLTQELGTKYIDEIDIKDIKFCDDQVTIIAEKGTAQFEFEAKFFIDGTGFNSLLAKNLNIRKPKSEISTPLSTRTIFTHFKGVKSLEATVGKGSNFNPLMNVHRSRGTQHHVFDGGWYWFIPFDNGVTSVGVSLDLDKFPENDLGAEEEFKLITSRLPVVGNLLKDAENTLPYIKTGRLQFETKQIIGDRWALLPAAAFGLDAWQSTGMTLSMIAIDRLVWLLDHIAFKFDKFKREALLTYEEQLMDEQRYLGKFVHGVYKSFKHKELFQLYCLLPHMGMERFTLDGGLTRPWDSNALLMSFGNPLWRQVFNKFYDLVIYAEQQETLGVNQIEEARKILVEDLSLFNNRKYGCPSTNNIYMIHESGIEQQMDKAFMEGITA